MAKQFYFYDSGGVRRKVKSFYFYDSAGARRKVKAGYFYDSFGERKQFFEGGLAGPPAGYYPGANFTIQVGQDAGGANFGYSAAGWGEIALDSSNPPGGFATFPSTDLFAKTAQLFIAQRVYSNNRMQFYWYKEGVSSEPPEWFEAMNVLDQNGNITESWYRGVGTLYLNPAAFGSGYLWQISYANPLTVGSIYTYQFKELGLNATVTPGTDGGVWGFLLGVTGSISVGTMRGFTVHGHWIDSSGALNFAVRVPTNSDPGKSWLAWCHGTGSSSHNNKLAKDATYTFTDSGAGYWIANWKWSAFGTASSPYPLKVA